MEGQKSSSLLKLHAHFLDVAIFMATLILTIKKKFFLSLAIPDLVVTHVYFQILSPPSRNSSITAFFTLIPKYLHYYQRKHSRNSSIILLFWSGVISFHAAGTGRRRFALFFGVLHVGMGQLGGRRN